jgi:hypothetical protein
MQTVIDRRYKPELALQFSSFPILNGLGLKAALQLRICRSQAPTAEIPFNDARQYSSG